MFIAIHIFGGLQNSTLSSNTSLRIYLKLLFVEYILTVYIVGRKNRMRILDNIQI